jgi:hypothetical protein
MLIVNSPTQELTILAPNKLNSYHSIKYDLPQRKEKSIGATLFLNKKRTVFSLKPSQSQGKSRPGRDFFFFLK